MLKGWIADRFNVEGRRLGLHVDISTDSADTLFGDDWYRFLLNCRFTIGVEGGASIHDRDGAVRDRVTAYVAEHPDASFDEIERSCFNGLDGTFSLRAISPRHLEACATRTLQILVEGSYNGILEPGIHYVPLRADFANISEALEEVSRVSEGTEMAERAYRDVVASGKYTYQEFVATLLDGAREDPAQRMTKASVPLRAVLAWEIAADRLSWALVWMRQQSRLAARGTLRRAGLLEAAKRVRGRHRRRNEHGV